MIKLRYGEVAGGFPEDEKKAQKTDHVDLCYCAELNKIFLYFDIDGTNRYLCYDFDPRELLRAIDQAMSEPVDE